MLRLGCSLRLASAVKKAMADESKDKGKAG